MPGQRPAESLFSVIKGVLLNDQGWPARTAVRRAITEYIAWYNGSRLHSAVAYKPPVEYEAWLEPQLPETAPFGSSSDLK